MMTKEYWMNELSIIDVKIDVNKQYLNKGFGKRTIKYIKKDIKKLNRDRKTVIKILRSYGVEVA